MHNNSIGNFQPKQQPSRVQKADGNSFRPAIGNTNVSGWQVNHYYLSSNRT